MDEGQELDTLIAEKVMGWKWSDGRGTAGPSYWETQDGKFAHFAEFEPSTNIADAWTVIFERFSVNCFVEVRWYGGMAECEINYNKAQAHTVPLAICLAALQSEAAQ